MSEVTGTVSTEFGSIEDQIVKARELIDEFIQSARAMKQAKDELLDTYQGRAANAYSDALDDITVAQQKEQEAIGAQIESKLRNWLEETRASEDRTTQAANNLG